MSRDFVYASARALFLDPPGSIIYHAKGRHVFPTYPYDEATSAKVGYPAAKRLGEEYGYTVCGRLTDYTEPDHRLVGTEWEGLSLHRLPMRAIRRDHAELLGRPCRACLRP